jgi:hypothetical protein
LRGLKSILLIYESRLKKKLKAASDNIE